MRRQGGSSVTASATFSGTPTNCGFGIISLRNLKKGTSQDTDSNAATSGTGEALTALNLPGDLGINIAAYLNDTHGTAVSWTNAIELVDTAFQSVFRASYAVALGNPAGDIDCDGANDAHGIAGVALR